MIWGDSKLKEFISQGYVEYAYGGCVNPASINLRLGHTWLVPKHVDGVIQLGDKVEYNQYDSKSFIIRPGEFILATTMEIVNISKDAAAFVQGRSSIGRAGLSVQNAGFVDPGFSGAITLEIKNDSPNCVRLMSGYPVVQLIIMDAEDVMEIYDGKYQGQTVAVGSRMQYDKFNPNTHEMESHLRC